MPGDRTRRPLVVLGAGLMGTGIAALAVAHGVPVLLVDPADAALAGARTAVRDQVRLARLMGVPAEDVAPGALSTACSVADAAGAEVVVEAVTESFAVKAEALASVSAVVRADTVLVSNTSSIPIGELAGAVPRPATLIGTHFMNPAYAIPTVEVIRGPQTGEQARHRLGALLTRLRRTPVEVADGPGFVTSRVLHPMLNDAVRVVAAGVATAAQVDTLFVGCLGHRTGPLRTADLIGLDNLADSLLVLHERTGDPGCLPHDLLLAKVRAGHLGRKSGTGFYEYGDLT